MLVTTSAGASGTQSSSDVFSNSKTPESAQNAPDPPQTELAGGVFPPGIGSPPAVVVHVMLASQPA